jgi:excisionase family DNA binding protein
VTVLTHKPSKDNIGDYCGTTFAAKILGVSVSTIHGLVEKNELRAWKTMGGHRRISFKSIQEYQRRHKITHEAMREKRVRIMVVDDDDSTRLLLQAYFDQWSLPLDVVMYSSAMQALLDMPTIRPEILFTDLRMAGVNGFQFLRILKEHSLFEDLIVLVMTGMSSDEILSHGGLPDRVQLFHKPIDFVWLRGFLDAMTSIRRFDL